MILLDMDVTIIRFNFQFYLRLFINEIEAMYVKLETRALSILFEIVFRERLGIREDRTLLLFQFYLRLFYGKLFRVYGVVYGKPFNSI